MDLGAERFLYYQNLNDTKIRVAVHQAHDTAIGTYMKQIEAVLVEPLAIHSIKLDYEHNAAKSASLIILLTAPTLWLSL